MYGLYTSNCANLISRNLIISKIHKSYPLQYAYGIGGDALDYTFEYNDVYDCSTAYYESGTPGVGCINSYPKYVNPSDDFHLQAGSPCIDTGDPAIEDFDSSRSDMGCYGGPGGDW